MNRLLLTVAVGTVLVGTAAAQNGRSADVIHARQANYKQMGAAMKAIVEEARRDPPSRDVVIAATDRLAYFAARIPRWFPRGSGPGAGVPTRAKAEIWTSRREFNRSAAGLQQAIRQLRAAGATGDGATLRPAVRALGAACANCHDRFRAPEH